ncbi:MAG TPA: hypothetical protein VFE17_09240 [Candidatus Baltobacteraceae bacterium]|nr:hypothetical protein [Candidatus Baltobacteraceae bacterium]
MTDHPRANNKQVSGLNFMAGIGGSAALLVGCSSESILPAAKNDLKTLMRRAKVIRIESGGLVYKDDGSILHAATEPLDFCPPATMPQSRRLLCSVTPASVSIGDSIAAFDRVGGFTLGLVRPIYSIGPGASPKYTPDVGPDCANPIPDAQEIATQMAEYIENHGTAFSSAIVRAAQNATSNWRGTGMGVAASVTAASEFIAVCFIGIDMAGILMVIAGVGLTAATVYEFYKCLRR